MDARVHTAEAALTRLEEMEGEDWVRDDTAERVRGVYSYRRRRFGAQADGDGDHFEGAPMPTGGSCSSSSTPSARH